MIANTTKISVPGLENYNGCKGGNGVYQQIISLIPPHKILVVPFLGHCGISRNIAPADILICVDASVHVIETWKNYLIQNLIYTFRDDISYYTFIKSKNTLGNLPNLILLHKDDALHFLPNVLPGIIYKYTDTPEQVLIYQDPPYPKFSRKGKRDLYEFEMTDLQHEQLLSMNKKMMSNILISTYDNNMYDINLKGWNKYSFTSSTRSGIAIETVYYNYKIGDGKLHDYRFLGRNFKDRERIKLKKNRWVKNLKKLDPRERMAIINEILKV